LIRYTRSGTIARALWYTTCAIAYPYARVFLVVRTEPLKTKMGL
jgi:hypothetical protein